MPEPEDAPAVGSTASVEDSPNRPPQPDGLPRLLEDEGQVGLLDRPLREAGARAIDQEGSLDAGMDPTQVRQEAETLAVTQLHRGENESGSLLGEGP